MKTTNIAISVNNLGKCYQLYDRPHDRLKQFLYRNKRQFYREFWALRDISFEITKGEVLGIVGRNGSGKSTLLQLICGTLTPTSGEVTVQGRIAALLELGAGFNPEFTGRENIFMSATIMGLSQKEIETSFEEIVDFSGIRDFIDQPVKTYSSGMYVRLAFSVAINVLPDILVIDEALSVGDGDFSRKSFDRIMTLKNAGKTILFCSHSLYQVEAICNRAIWLHQGRIKTMGEPSKVIADYNEFLDSGHLPELAPSSMFTNNATHNKMEGSNSAHITKIEVTVDGQEGRSLLATSGKSEIVISISFASDPALPPPVVAAGFETNNGQLITSAFTNIDGIAVNRDQNGKGNIALCFPQLPLLKGTYWVNVAVACEKGIHIYELAMRVAEIHVSQANIAPGIVSLPHEWTHPY